MGAVVLFALLAAATPSAPDGRQVFERCYACHSVDPKEQRLPGPNLAGVLGRRAAALEGFEYSDAMRRAGARGLTWTEATLDRFLADPEAVAPGTEMFMPPLRNPADRAALIKYLRSLEPSR